MSATPTRPEPDKTRSSETTAWGNPPPLIAQLDLIFWRLVAVTIVLLICVGVLPWYALFALILLAAW